MHVISLQTTGASLSPMSGILIPPRSRPYADPSMVVADRPARQPQDPLTLAYLTCGLDPSYETAGAASLILPARGC